MSAKRQILITQSLAFASQLLPAIIGVLSFMWLVRVTVPVVLGEYLIYMAAVVMFEMVKSGGLQSALVMRIAKSDTDHRRQISGSAYWLAGTFSLAVSVILVVLYVLPVFANSPGVRVFCGWYAVVGLLTVPLHIAEAEAIARQELKFILSLRLAQSANALIIAAYASFGAQSLEALATVHLCFTAVLLIVVLLLRRTNPTDIRHRVWSEIAKLFHLVKYTLATLGTTNLLKTADTFLIGALMGPAAVALYAVPLKLTELFEIPLRSLSTTAFPQLAGHFNHQDRGAFKYSFVQYVSWSYLLYLPALIGAFILAPWLVVLLGGQAYAETASVFRVLILFGLFLPLNRMTGISLDALQLPKQNFYKVAVMALINIIGDWIAIKYTGSLNWVAFVSVLNAATGAVLGWWLLQRAGFVQSAHLGKEVWLHGEAFITKSWNRLVHR